MYFDDFLSRLNKEEGPRLFLLFGDSESVISEGARVIKEKFKRSKPSGVIQNFEGGTDSLGDALTAAQSTGLFSNAQLLVFRRAEKVLGGHSEAALQQLKEYFSDPNPESCLVFLAPGMKKTVKAVAAAERVGWAVQCSDLPEWKMTEWLLREAKGRGLSLAEEAAQLLIQKVGPNIAFLQRALEQLEVYVFPKKSASAEDVRELPAPGVESEIFAFLDAAASRQAAKALALLARLQDGIDAGTTMMLYSRTRELLVVSLGRSKGLGQAELAGKLGIHPFRVKNLWEQAAHFSAAELKRALMDLIHLQAGVVTGRLGKNTPAVLLESWVLKWARGQAQGSRA